MAQLDNDSWFEEVEAFARQAAERQESPDAPGSLAGAASEGVAAVFSADEEVRYVHGSYFVLGILAGIFLWAGLSFFLRDLSYPPHILLTLAGTLFAVTMGWGGAAFILWCVILRRIHRLEGRSRMLQKKRT